METAEAEDVFVALIPPLVWASHSWDGKVRQALGESESADRNTPASMNYEVCEMGQQWQAIRHIRHQGQEGRQGAVICTRLFQTMDAGKAACNRHNAIGKWH